VLLPARERLAREVARLLARVHSQGATGRRAALHAQLAELQRRQSNLMRELSGYQPTGDADLDTAWRNAIQAQFAANLAEQRAKTRQLADLTQRHDEQAPPDIDLLDAVPQAAIHVTALPEDSQRRLYDAFHLAIRYHQPSQELILRVSIDAETAPVLTATIHSTTNIPAPRPTPETRKAGARANAPAPGQAMGDVLSAPGRIPDRTVPATTGA
jgi:site-specific DNA recombinase